MQIGRIRRKDGAFYPPIKSTIFNNRTALSLCSRVLFCFLLSQIATAQPVQLKFEHLTLENGISHSKVNCIVQDFRGFMWFGTDEGLNRYDGYQFTVYQNNSNDPGSLSANFIRCLLEDSGGNLWIGTEIGGLNRYDRAQERFTHFTADSASDIRLHDNYINSIVEDRNGNLWLGTNNGIELLDVKKKKAFPFFPDNSGNVQNEVNKVNVVYMDRKQNLWVGTNSRGLCLFDTNQKRFTHYRHAKGNPGSLSDDEIFSIHEDLQGNLWIGTNKGVLNRFDPARHSFQKFYLNENTTEIVVIRAILDDGKGNLWVGNRFGVHNFDRKTNRFMHYVHDPENPSSLSQNSVQVIYKDAKGDLWIGTRGGLNYLNKDMQPFTHYRASANNPKYLNNQVVYAICEDRQGDLWFGTEEGGLNRLNRKTGLFTYYTHEIENPNSLNANNIKAILEDRDGNLWICTFNGGLNCYDRKNDRFIHYMHDPSNPNSITHNDVMAILEDRSGILWVGTYENGLDRFDKKNHRFVHILNSKNVQGSNTVQPLMEDHEGKIWAGLNHFQVGVFDKTTGKWTIMKLDERMNFNVRCLLEDHAHTIWFGTLGGGLYFWNRKQKIQVALTKQNGLTSNVIYGILEDRHGNLWLSTTNGLVRYNPATKAIKTFFKENGLLSNQFCYNAYFTNRNGTMFFGGIQGVTAFHPDSVRENTYLPPVVITDFKIFNKPVAIGGKNPILKQSICETREITLSHKQSVFTFEFSALNFASSRQNQYAYRMEGFERDWNYVNDRRFATYTNLKHGRYTFRVKAANNDGVWNEQGASIRLMILPPFWLKWWFKVAGVIAALFVIKHTINYQVQKRNVLKARALANVAQLKLLRNQMNPHFLFNAHNSIRSMILIDKDRAWQMVTELSEFLRYTLLNFNKIEATLGDEISAVNNYLHIEKIRYRDSLEVSFQIDESAKECLVPAFFLQPLIENAIKYGMQTSSMPLRVSIAIHCHRKMLSIDVSNTGKLVHVSVNPSEGDEAHGTSIDNIRKRLEILFKDQHTFQLFEKNSWVHVKMKIRYDKSQQEKWIQPEQLAMQEKFAEIK